MIIMDILIDRLDFCKDFLNASILSICEILVYEDCTSSETEYESSVILLTSSVF